ncbi:restriction endonuclease subunit S [Fischerella sp. PCC 9605]|uniref:restriction endonuclease subunit S n=1 Tax=Fischerella sp. PCC 9605 TaxID=1173024 RepID=UPI00047A9390|nr:restriction endonuclease subunit S [Fischerella sp. PCC 9605]
MSEQYQKVRFDKFLKRIERKITVDDSITYSCVGVRWYGMGAFVREQQLGMNIARKQQWVIKSGDIVYNKLFAWQGSFAIADKSVDGCIVSDKFPTYEADISLIDLKYLNYYFRTKELTQQAQNLSKGAAAISKLTLNPSQFWDLTIPLPSLEEQRRIVARVEELVGKIEEVRSLRQKALIETEALLAVESTKLLSKTLIKGQLSDVLLEKPRNGWSARCDNMPEGTPILSLGAVTGFSYRQTEFKRTSEPVSLDAHYWLKPGDLLITRSNTPELVGHAAIYNGSPYPCIYPDLMMRLEIDEFKANKQFVHHWLACTLVRDYIKSKAKGTSPTMKKISQEVVMNIPFPSDLSICEQRRIVAYLDELQTKVDKMKRLREEAIKELDALLPSILDKAFKGEL